MAVTKAIFQAAFNCTVTKVNTGFKTVTLPDGLSYSYDADVDTYNAVYLDQGTLAASASETLDLFGTLSDLLGNSYSAKTKFAGILITTSGAAATATLRLEPGDANPLSLGLYTDAGSDPAVCYILRKAGGAILLTNPEGQHETISSTARNIKLTNTGSTTLTYNVAILLG